MNDAIHKLSAEYNRKEAVQIFNSFWEDDNANMFFYYCGKNSVLGLAHPDYILKNTDKHNYARVAFYTFNDVGDNSIVAYMNETLDIMTITSVTDKTNAGKMKNFKIHFEADGQAGRVHKDSVKCVVDNCNNLDYLNNKDMIPKVLVTEDTYLDSENKTKYGVGLWVDISSMTYLMVGVDKSISANSVPVNAEHFPSSYTVEYISNINKEADVNLINVEKLLKDRLIIESTDKNAYNDSRLDKLEEKTKFEPHQFHQNTVQYNPTYEPRRARTEETVQGTTIIGPVLDRIVTLDPVNKVFRVQKHGIYALQLKNGFYLVQGETRLDLNVYIGSSQIKEMRISSYLKSNPEGQDDEGKVIKNTYSSQVYIVELDPTMDIKLTANWMNIDNLVLENETMITITALQYNIPEE